jgi:hypothetical protein
MISFSKFLLEQQDPEEGASRQIKHLTHVEDRPLQTGEKGALRSLSVLKAAADHIASGKKSSELTTKYDGSPSIVYGHHPDSGKFFVASKSAFNKTPKINYTENDIEKNHGHAPGLVEKLKHALRHLPKTTPETGVYQGDMMFSPEDKKTSKTGGVSFNPNPSGLTYTAHGDLGKKAKRAKIGVVTHIKYEGKDSGSLNASHKVDHENFKEHSDVFTVNPQMDTSKVHFGPKERAEFNKHIAAAEAVHNTHGDDMYAGTSTHHGIGGHLESYINHTVRSGETPNHQNFKNWLETKKNKEIDKLKVEKNKKAKSEELGKELSKIESNKKHYNNLFKIHGHLQKAKNVLINVMNQHQQFQHQHAGENANPEGYVFHHKNDTDKFVNRQEFSKRNFEGIRNI